MKFFRCPECGVTASILMEKHEGITKTKFEGLEEEVEHQEPYLVEEDQWTERAGTTFICDNCGEEIKGIRTEKAMVEYLKKQGTEDWDEGSEKEDSLSDTTEDNYFIPSI